MLKAMFAMPPFPGTFVPEKKADVEDNNAALAKVDIREPATIDAMEPESIVVTPTATAFAERPEKLFSVSTLYVVKLIMVWPGSKVLGITVKDIGVPRVY